MRSSIVRSTTQTDAKKVITHQVRGSDQEQGYIQFGEAHKGVRIFGGVVVSWVPELGEDDAWIRFSDHGIRMLQHKNGQAVSANVPCASLNDRPL
ncbi:hypothetical protein GCM10009678_94340 [Actinomadura kijaniata]|uniref:Uncharacterized protein n=1 Tax=Actinomadura namibiensis TaxID=182080 RepID=A0A7W3QQF1_ACTNM|nr:hypothetical protein [Actinomadura namibiensis]MBA8955645.1 hypothetical protein [Actinomadura namibiensis]